MVTKGKVIDLLYESNLIENEPSGLMMTQAVKAWNHVAFKKVLTLRDILATHRILMEKSDMDSKYKGAIRDIYVTVDGRRCPDPFLVPALLDNFIFDFKDMDPTLAHIRFEKIHPFIDGNGRIGRIIWIWHCIHTGKPYPEFSHEDRNDYYELFI